MQGQRWPLMIDPQAQANRWLRKMLEKDLLVSTMTDINLVTGFGEWYKEREAFADRGRPRVRIEPALEPVLAKAIFTEGARALDQTRRQQRSPPVWSQPVNLNLKLVAAMASPR